MSTTSYSVMNEMTEKFQNHPRDYYKFRLSRQGNRARLVYESKYYDVTVTKLCPDCGEDMDFGSAIRCLKEGLMVTRKGWNNMGMWLWLEPGKVLSTAEFQDQYLQYTLEQNGGEIPALETICMHTHDANGRRVILTGWVASQADMLAEDWVVVAGWPKEN